MYSTYSLSQSRIGRSLLTYQRSGQSALRLKKIMKGLSKIPRTDGPGFKSISYVNFVGANIKKKRVIISELPFSSHFHCKNFNYRLL